MYSHAGAWERGKCVLVADNNAARPPTCEPQGAY